MGDRIKESPVFNFLSGTKSPCTFRFFPPALTIYMFATAKSDHSNIAIIEHRNEGHKERIMIQVLGFLYHEDATNIIEFWGKCLSYHAGFVHCIHKGKAQIGEFAQIEPKPGYVPQVPVDAKVATDGPSLIKLINTCVSAIGNPRPDCVIFKQGDDDSSELWLKVISVAFIDFPGCEHSCHAVEFKGRVLQGDQLGLVSGVYDVATKSIKYYYP